MAGLAIRSVLLTADTTQAWKEADVQFARRGRTQEAIIQMGRESGYEFLLNLGRSQFQPTMMYDDPLGFFWNSGQDILPLLYPGLSRELLNDLMPPKPTTYPADVWIKAPGMKGKGKYKKNIPHALTLPPKWDHQLHVEGTEYRVVTVGRRAVQSFVKTDVGDGREYEWVGLRDTPREIKRIARKAAKRLPGLNVIGWDIVLGDDDQPLIFEGNSCPGVNWETARRIVQEIRRQKGELEDASN